MRLNVLFVCSRNQWRSPTAERLYRHSQLISARSAGTSPRARTAISEAHLRWADLVCAMETKHRDRLRARFSSVLRHTAVVVLDIPDEYRFMDPELVDILKAKIDPLIAEYREGDHG